ncbi:dihydrolipoyl dehydrogenase [bacterium]|nr:dihydrolipoyl dehydrogenase [bacterium]
MDKQPLHIAVIGAGPGGYPAAFYAADLGMTVTLIDPEEHPGGVCLHRGCIPTKTLLHGIAVIHEAASAAEFGITFSEPAIDIVRMRRKKDEVVTSLTSGLMQLAKQRGVTYLRGRAVFRESRVLEVTGTDGSQHEITPDYTIIASGSRPAVIPSLHLDSERLIYSAEALNITDIPESLLVVGGGYIGLEMGTIYAALGSRVSIVELMDTILPGADGDLVRTYVRSAGPSFAEILTGARVETIVETADGCEVTVRTKKDERLTRSYAKVLMTVGRTPNSDTLGLERTGVLCDERGFIKTDASLRTNDPAIYAIGDVVGGAMLAHKATAEGKAAVNSIAGRKGGYAPKTIPAVLFTDPEITWCGLTEQDARRENIPVKTARFMWGASGRAASIGRSDGMTKIIVDPDSDRVLGVGIVGPGAGELIAEAVLAIENGLTAADIAAAIHPHPTLSETMMEAAEAVHGYCTHLYQPRR